MKAHSRNPLIPALLVGIGLALVGVALGLLYIDYIQRGGFWLEFCENTDADDLASWGNINLILVALPVGSLGAGLCGAGFIVTLNAMLLGRPTVPANSRNSIPESLE